MIIICLMIVYKSYKLFRKILLDKLTQSQISNEIEESTVRVIESKLHENSPSEPEEGKL